MEITDPLYSDQLITARAQFEEFLDALNPLHPITILCDGDVDGLGAGVTLFHHLTTQHNISPDSITVLHPNKGENAFTPTTRGYVVRTHPRALFVLDLGISDRRIIHTVPALFIDHHHPTGQPPESVVLTGYDWNPIPTSSLLTYLLCNSDDVPTDIAWKAAIGNLGDLGPDHPTLSIAAKTQKLKWIREATTILNAAKRSRLYPQAEAFRALLTAHSAQEIAEGTTPDLTLLKQCRTEVKAALDEAKKLAPKFSKTEHVALLEFSDPNRIHPLLAQSWHGRLPRFIVIAANHGWLPNTVAFSARTSSGANILDLLQKYRHIIPDELEYGYGHDQAAGGVISSEGWQKLKSAMSLP
jgi:single-stranded-DNA-specific exonuclease